VAGEYVKNNADLGGNAWNLRATVGDQMLVKKGQQNVQVLYANVGTYSIGRWTTLDLANVPAAFDDATAVQAQKVWGVYHNYAFSKNLISTLEYVKVTDKHEVAVVDGSYDFFKATLTAKF